MEQVENLQIRLICRTWWHSNPQVLCADCLWSPNSFNLSFHSWFSWNEHLFLAFSLKLKFSRAITLDIQTVRFFMVLLVSAFLIRWRFFFFSCSLKPLPVSRTCYLYKSAGMFWYLPCKCENKPLKAKKRHLSPLTRWHQHQELWWILTRFGKTRQNFIVHTKATILHMALEKILSYLRLKISLIAVTHITSGSAWLVFDLKQT